MKFAGLCILFFIGYLIGSGVQDSLWQFSEEMNKAVPVLMAVLLPLGVYFSVEG